MHNNMWGQDDFRKIFQVAQDEKVHKKMMAKALNQMTEEPFLIEEIKILFKEDYMSFIDILSQVYNDIEPSAKADFYQWIIENSNFQTVQEIEQEVQYYTFFQTIISNWNQYLSKYTLTQVIDNLHNQNELESSTYYLLARYYHDHKLHKRDFVYREGAEGKMLYHIVDAYFQNKIDDLLDVTEHFLQQEELVKKASLGKKITKIIHKATGKLKNIYVLQDCTYQELQSEITRLQTDTKAKLSQVTLNENYNDFPEVQQFFNDCIELSENLIEEKIEPIVKEEPIFEKVNEDHLYIIQQFYESHHLYFKKSQIIEELLKKPFIIDFYLFYQKIQKEVDDEKKLNLLEELQSDIHESGLKKDESVRRLLNVLHKDIENFLRHEEDKSEPPQQSPHTIQIGKFSVIEESVEDNPVDLQKLICLLNESSQNQLTQLKKLIYQIGYDKVQGYLLKHPQMLIEDLQSIVRLDRSLRFEYQRILEDIELYFRSSLTYYLTNKYDQKYLIPNTNQYFYKRGYLMKNKFIDYNEHYEHVKMLREQIDREMKNHNMLVVNEYQRYRYAIPLSTAAGMMSFGWIINMFENLNYYDKSEYLRTYYQNISPQTFGSWMMSLGNLRNHCAHYQSFYRISLLKELRPIMTKDIDANHFDDDMKHSSLFYYTMIMARLSPDISNIEDFIDSMGILMRKAGREISTYDMKADYSFPKNWRIILEQEKNTKIYLND